MLQLCLPFFNRRAKTLALASHETTTAIVGAGVIGLCTAYQLAKESRCITYRVIVIEAADDVFANSSGTNTGILSENEFQDDLVPLGQYSYSEWERLGSNESFRRACGYREHVNFKLSPGSGIGHDLIPDWVRMEADWDAAKEPKDGRTAIVNPVALGLWLYNQCLALGVEFRMNSQAVSATLSNDNRLQDLILMDDDGGQSTLTCDNLVLAAGPWTPVVFETLFPQAPIKIEAVIDAGDWIIFSNPELRSAKPIAAVYFDEIVGEKLEFAGRNDQKVWATGPKSPIGTLPKAGDAPEPDEKAILKLLANATRFLKHKQGDGPGLHVVQQGRSFRPETPSRLPIISAVPGSKLTTQDTTILSDDRRPSVFINSGHGSHGISLGMGSGKVMSQIILGRKPDVDLSKMGFSQSKM